MAVSKIWPVRYSLKRVLDYAANPDKTEKKDYSDEQYQALADVLSYAENEEKTEREFYVEGINCNPVEAREQFVMIKQQYGKQNRKLSEQERTKTPPQQGYKSKNGQTVHKQPRKTKPKRER